ncbi:MAG: pyridoxal phosphate-dependent aminotransferase [Myxococcales bacterium]|nr:pyridoxal phosphate-dependent aminotransferase [Myxococcales bacterium]
MNSNGSSTPEAFRPVPRTGVIYVMTEAERLGFRMHHEDWCNLGQGQPDTGELPGAPPRIDDVRIGAFDQDYAPIAGLWELREAIADLYNNMLRRGLPSQYTAENVCISGGGRVSLMRACAAVSQINLGHFLPDYTAYEELLDIFRRFTPIPILLDPERGYRFTTEQLRREILGRGLGALLMSNPCNPTGKLVGGEDLSDWVGIARELDCTLMVDEFYSHYIWSGDNQIESAARYVEDVDRDPVVIFDGLTKNWRYPGWRVTWSIGPKKVIEAITSAGSFLDGGASAPMQRAAVELLDPKIVQAETQALHTAFKEKRDLLVAGLRELGVRFDCEPEGTFYAWGDLSALPESVNTGMSFFKAALEKKVITVPGTFFDVDPGQRRIGRPSRFRHHTRFSYGPDKATMERALERMREIVDSAP